MEHRAEFEAFLVAATDALELRNEVVHSLWPFSAGGASKGWRTPPRRKRVTDEVVWTELVAVDLPELVTLLLDLYAECRRLEDWLQMSRASYAVTETSSRG